MNYGPGYKPGKQQPRIQATNIGYIPYIVGLSVCSGLTYDYQLKTNNFFILAAGVSYAHE